MSDPLLADLAALLARSPGEAERRRAADHVADWIACATAGAASDAGRAVLSVVQSESGPIRSLGRAEGLPARAAAFAMGALGNPLEMDDVDRAGILHPGPVIVPAALAVGQRVGASGAALLDAIAVGYEATIRLGRSVGPGHYALWHNTATCGPVGAAAAAARLLHLDGERTLWALGNALTQASGPWAMRHEPVMTKQLHTARAAEAGLTAALLAEAGFTGPARILEGPQGFYAGMCPDPEPAQITADPESWRIHEVSFKPWPACRHCHPAIDAALALRDRVDPGEVSRIEIAVYADAARMCDRPEPTTVLEAKFSLQHAVALALLDGPPDLTAFDPPAWERSDATGLRGRAEVVIDPEISARYPRRFGARVATVLTDGRRLTEARTDARGDPQDPMDAAAHARKAHMLFTAAGLGAAAAERASGAARALPEAPDLSALLDALPADLPATARITA